MGSQQINRHRRYRRDRLSARYVRLRDHVELRVADYDTERGGEGLHRERGDGWYDEREYDEREHEDARRDPQLDYTWPALRRSLERSVPFNAALSRPPGIVAPALIARTRRSPERLERALIEHLAACELPIEAARLGGALLHDRVMAGDPELTRRELSALWQHGNEKLHCAVALLLFRPFWLRSPETWRPAAGTSLVEHLLSDFPVARVLLSAWKRAPDMLDLRMLAWTIAAAQGASLRRLARLGHEQGLQGWFPLPKKFSAQLGRVPCGLSLAQTCAYAEVLRLGGEPVEYRRLTSNHSFRQDPLALSPAARAFWSQTVRWLREQRDALSQRGVTLVLAWARHLHTEAQRGRRPAHDWSARSLAQTLHDADLYHQQFGYGGYPRRYRPPASPRPELSWRARGWDWRVEERGKTWIFTELLSSAQLRTEGSAMRHCVRSYDRSCAQGRSAIFSVEVNAKRVLTVELQPAARRILQVHGKCNRDPQPAEQAMLERWLAQVWGKLSARSTTTRG